VESVPPELRDLVGHEFSAVMRAAASRVLPATQRRHERLWRIWKEFLGSLGPVYPNQATRDPYLRYAQTHKERLHTLLLFAWRYRSGQISASGKPTKVGSVAEALRVVSTKFELDGLEDPRRRPGQPSNDLLLASVLKAWSNQDEPPHRVRPFPIQLLEQVVAAAQPLSDAAGNTATPSAYQECLRDLTIIGFFYLLRSSEYTHKGANSAPFRVCDVTLWNHHVKLNLRTASDEALLQATRSYLTFTTQKSGVRNEQIGHGKTRHPFICPTAAIARRVIHLRRSHLPDTAPLCQYVEYNNAFAITPKHVTSHLKMIAGLFGEPFGFTQADVSTHSLRAGGATALFIAGVPIETIRLLGRWHSDTVFRYIHAQALPILDATAQRMLTNGNITFAPLPDHNLLP
jgi:hypothetical protein